MTTALQQSRAAHLAYRQALATQNGVGVKAALQTALDQRLAADTLDPDHSALAWTLDPYTKLHTDLLVFYRQELAKA